MMGQKGASLETTRRIWRRMARDLAECRSRLDDMRALGRVATLSWSFVSDTAESLAESLAPGGPPPVGVLTGVWHQVCREYHDKPPVLRPRKNPESHPPV